MLTAGLHHKVTKLALKRDSHDTVGLGIRVRCDSGNKHAIGLVRLFLIQYSKPLHLSPLLNCGGLGPSTLTVAIQGIVAAICLPEGAPNKHSSLRPQPYWAQCRCTARADVVKGTFGAGALLLVPYC